MERKNIKKVYGKVLNLIGIANRIYDILEKVGLCIDFDDENKPLSKYFRSIMEEPKEIVCDLLGLELKVEDGFYEGVDKYHLHPITLDVYYPDDGDINFSIVYDAMIDLLDIASKDANCALKVWDCFVDKKVEAKESLLTDYHVSGFAQISE